MPYMGRNAGDIEFPSGKDKSTDMNYYRVIRNNETERLFATLYEAGKGIDEQATTDRVNGLRPHAKDGVIYRIYYSPPGWPYPGRQIDRYGTPIQDNGNAR